MAGNPNSTSELTSLPPPGTDMTGICFRDQLWLNTYPLDRSLVFDYFALSPFYDVTCNNEQIRLRSIHPLDLSHLSKMTGNEYMLNEVMEPHLFVMRKQKRDGPEKVTPMLTYYILDGSVYQAPQRLLVAYLDAENEDTSIEPKGSKDTIDFKELKRADHILMSLQRKLPLAPPPPPFPEGYVPPSTTEEKDQEEANESQVPSDPILDQGPSKRLKY